VAILVPEIFGRRIHSAAEAKIANRFRTEVEDPAVLMHSVGLVRHQHKRWAEVDFVLISEQGVFCLEVKGGVVKRTDGVWSFTDRNGHVDTKHEGPFEQAGGGATALRRWLLDHGVRRTDGSPFEVGYAVMVPDCVLDASGPDIEQQLLCDKRHGDEELSQFVDRIAGYWRHRKPNDLLSHEEIASVGAAVRPDFEALVTRPLVAEVVNDELIRLSEDQARVVYGLKDNERLLATGAAGTGKSMLAVAEANRLAAQGKRVLLVCHTRALANALLHCTSEGVETSTVGALMYGLVDRARLTDELPDATPDAIFDLFLPPLAIRALHELSEAQSFDALVIDEAQDLLREQTVRFLDEVLRSGFEQGSWRIFLDPNQNIFGQVAANAMTIINTGQPARFTLNENCRNTEQIAEFSTLLSGASVQADANVSGPEVRFSSNWDEPWMQRSCNEVEQLLAEGLPSRDVTLLARTRHQVDALVVVAPDLLSSNRDRTRVHTTTVGAFKGLDSTAVVLTGLTDLDHPDQRRAAYIGTTRAKVQLTVVLPGDARESFERRVKEYALAKSTPPGDHEQAS